MNQSNTQDSVKEDDYPRFSEVPVFKKVTKLYDGRIRQFTDKGGEYRELNLPKFYDRARWDHTDSVRLEVYSVPNLERPHFKEAMEQAVWKRTSKGQSFGPSWSTHWFKIDIRLNKEWRNAEQILFEWNCGNEGLIYTESGSAVVGLSGEQRREWIVPFEWRDEKWHRFYIETSCNQMFGNNSPPDPNRYFRLVTADLVVPNLQARALYIDFWIIGDASREFPNDSWQKHKARDVCNRIINAFDLEHPDESIAKGREIAREYIGNVDSSYIYYNGKHPRVFAIGNCHIDTAWLWPFAETHRKIGRSWATQLDLIEKYPEYNFTTSQMQQFKWLSEDYPDLFEKVKEQAKAGRFIPVGGSWVENDTNMPSGDGLVRQLLLGQRFMETHFGKRTRTYWLPDTFGYSPQIPQICRLAEMDRFLTQKLSWNNINTFPHSTFNWVALDGSQVLCHMPPDNTYTASAHFGDVSRSLRQHKNLDTTDYGLMLFGYGDGGGGPTAEMIEKLRRCRGLSDTVEELPRVTLKVGVDDFYDTIQRTTNNGKTLATWVGELYLEFHRGTYTTQAAIKKGNRQSEILMHDVEYLATVASLKNSNYSYPTKEIDELWEKVCLNQFHDVLPGSGIEMIYEDARAIYEEVALKGTLLIREALEALDITVSEVPDHELAALNTLPWPRSEIVEDPTTSIDSSSGVSQRKYIHFTTDGPGLIAKPSVIDMEEISSVHVKETEPGVFVLENGKLRVVIEGGALTSVYDIEENRQVLADGKKGNQLVIFEDQPTSYPAWDTELYSLETKKDIEPGTVRILESGPLKASVEVQQKISFESTIKTIISLYPYNKGKSAKKGSLPSYIEFECEVDWHETYRFLKVEFPVDVHNDTASYETQFGYQKRPTHYNTTWDVAKFEVCAHKWADLSDYSYGVSVLNNCKYGYGIHGNIISLSLLRAPKSPDAHADMGKHHFKYALLPHKGTLNSGVVRAAYNFNNPLRPVFVRKQQQHLNGIPIGNDAEIAKDDIGLLNLSGSDSLVISCIKRFEDDEDISRGELPIRGKKGTKSIIIRVYDSLGGRSRGFLECKLPVKRVFKTNILEDDLEQLDVLTGMDLDRIPIELRPFEVATYRLEL